MNNAPSVTYPVARPLVAGLVAAGVWLAGAASTLAWTMSAETPGWRQAGGAFALAASGAYALLCWLRSMTGDLHWDGSGWAGPRNPQVGSLQVALDLQRLLLVRWVGPDGARWLWLERHRCPQRWRDLRRAVYSRARPMALPAGRPPAAKP